MNTLTTIRVVLITIALCYSFYESFININDINRVEKHIKTYNIDNELVETKVRIIDHNKLHIQLLVFIPISILSVLVVIFLTFLIEWVFFD